MLFERFPKRHEAHTATDPADRKVAEALAGRVTSIRRSDRPARLPPTLAPERKGASPAQPGAARACARAVLNDSSGRDLAGLLRAATLADRIRLRQPARGPAGGRCSRSPWGSTASRCPPAAWPPRSPRRGRGSRALRARDRTVILHCRQAHRPRSSSSSACDQLAPPSIETSTRATCRSPPANAYPRTSTGPAATVSPSTGDNTSELSATRPSGIPAPGPGFPSGGNSR